MNENLSGKENIEILRFSSEQGAELTKRGFKIFELRGESITSLKEKGVAFWSNWHKDLELEMLKSDETEVAVMAKEPFIANSGNITLLDQWCLVNDYSKKLSSEIKGVKAIIGTAIDYLDLDFQCKKDSGMSLFRRAGSYDSASSATMSDEGYSLFVGQSYNEMVVMSYRFGKSGYGDIKVMPLIIPSNY